MLLLTNREVHTERYLDRSFKKLRFEYFLYGTNNWLIKALLYSHNKTFVKFSKCYRKVLGKLSANRWNVKMKI